MHMGYLENVLSRVPGPVRQSIEQIMEYDWVDYPIRAHHLYKGSFPTMACLVGLEKPKESMILMAKLNRAAYFCANFPESRAKNGDGDKYLRWYAADVVGEKGEHAETYARVIAAAYLAFFHLDDCHPVAVSGNPDLICMGCSRGEHCRGGKRIFGVELNTPQKENLRTCTFLEEVGGDERNLVELDGGVLQFRTDAGTVKRFLKGRNGW